MSGEKPIVKLFVPPSFEGVMTVAIIEDCIHEEEVQLETHYVNHIDFREYGRFKDADIVLVVGLPYKGYALPRDFYINLDVPFMDFIHSSTYGERIQGEYIISNIDPNIDPIKDIINFIRTSPESTLLSKYLTITDKTLHLVEAVNAYRTWSWENNNVTRVLLALYHSAYKYMPRVIKDLSLQEIVKVHAPVIKGQMEKIEDYIARKSEMTKTYEVEIDGEKCLLKVVFADNYINELANHLLNNEPTSMPVIVCVGRTTKSSDILSIRTNKIEASKVAYLINEGGGKDSVASVFLDVSYGELMGNAIVASLQKHLQNANML